ncbi:Hypothetical predicted protein [Octopus vulgaris]|uniref:Uncharacterized protein n=1 Tax=Octopus vulgaris TaxID=6645 RepID=A0AA36AS63_OCTVU|nr:Hypothetical predicted protein [Octopus vulgaris]
MFYRSVMEAHVPIDITSIEIAYSFHINEVCTGVYNGTASLINQKGGDTSFSSESSNVRLRVCKISLNPELLHSVQTI